MLGAAPNTEWLNCVALDEKGFVRTGISAACDDPANSHALSQPLATSCPGIFAVGDVRSGSDQTRRIGCRRGLDRGRFSTPSARSFVKLIDQSNRHHSSVPCGRLSRVICALWAWLVSVRRHW